MILLACFFGLILLLCIAADWQWLKDAKTIVQPQKPSPSPLLIERWYDPTPVPSAIEVKLAHALIPPADPYDLAKRLRHISGPFPVPTPALPAQYAVGDGETFWALNLDTAESFPISATLRCISPHLYMWVQEGISLSQDALEKSTQAFEERLYPTVRHYFGTEPSPGIDNDVHLNVLNARFSGAAGYFSSSDQYPSRVIPTSNEREMFYINLSSEYPGSASYEATLAHEFQHMVHWFADPNEDSWITEGASELAMHLCGYRGYDRSSVFARSPDTQLNHWNSGPNATAAHYGAAFLFMAYFAERFGPQVTRELVANPANGIAGFNAVLQAQQVAPAESSMPARTLSFDDLFADWVVANYLDGESNQIATGPYAYQSLDVQVQPERAISSYPAKGDGQVHQYAADYIVLEPSGQDWQLYFTATATTRLIPNQAHSGRYQWWSNRGDSSNMTLTRSFDLHGLKEASLQVWLWYDIEENWDYAYIEASTNGGLTWHILPGRYTTTENPNGYSYGPGYTGTSSTNRTSPGSAEWIQETFDLSPVAGQQVLIRFEYLTDDAVNHVGLCVDDIHIPELGYVHDAEDSDDGWVPQGFIRTDNELSQRYILQVILLTDHVTIERLFLYHQPSATLTIQGSQPDLRQAVVVISAVTPGSTETASYHYEILPLKSPTDRCPSGS